MSTTDVRKVDLLDAREQAFPKVNLPFRVYFEEDAFDILVAHGLEDTSREVGGILVGEVLKDSDGPYVHVQAVIKAEHAQESYAEFTITHTAWDHINRVMDAEHHNRQILGWYHTHPGFGLFLSDRDMFIQQSFFNLPFHIALVFDPKNREHCVFAWKDGAQWRLRSYFVGERECVWDGLRTPVEQQKPTGALTGATDDGLEQPGAEHQTTASPTSPSSGPGEESYRPGSLLFYCFMALLLGLGAGWLLASWRAGEALQAAGTQAAGSQAECATIAYQRLNSDLLRLLRSQLDGQKTLQPLAKISADLRAQADSLAGPPGERSKKELSGLLALAGSLDEWVARRSSAELALRQLEVIARQKPIDPQDLMKKQQKLRGGLANLYAEVAGHLADKDGDLARRLLMGAADLDPGGYERYNKQYRKTGAREDLPRGPDSPDGNHDKAKTE